MIHPNMNLVLLSLYVEILPGKAKEIRTIQRFIDNYDSEF